MNRLKNIVGALGIAVPLALSIWLVLAPRTR